MLEGCKLFKFKLLVALCCVVVPAQILAQGAIVKWVDENGKVHFGDRPPVDKNVKVETIQKSAEELAAEAAAEDLAAQAKAAERAPARNMDPEKEIERIKYEAGIASTDSVGAIENRAQCRAAYPAENLSKNTKRGARVATNTAADKKLTECYENVCRYYDDCE